MKLVLEPSLERFTLVKIVTGMWNQRDVRSLMSVFSFRLPLLNRHENWQNVENRVMDKVSDLPLPEILHEKVKCFIKPIGLQILKWMEYHCEDRYLHLNLPAEFCWTSQGLIDARKTAAMMIQDDKMDITNRYKLACIYCLEKNIPELRKKMSAKLRESFSYTGLNQGKIFLFWEKKMLAKEIMLYYNSNLSLQSIFESSALSGNKAATEYFFEKLMPEHREELLIKVAKQVENAEVFCYLLMQIDEESRTQVFENRASKKLEFFLNWPFQSLFLETMNKALDFFHCTEFTYLLSKVVEKIKLGYKDWDYPYIFRILWQECPSHHKSFVISCFTDGFLLQELVEIGDKKSMNLITQEMSCTQKENLVCGAIFHNVCESLFLKKDWDMLRFLIHEFLLSDEAMSKFKKKFERRPTVEKNLRLNKHKWNKLLYF